MTLCRNRATRAVRYKVGAVWTQHEHCGRPSTDERRGCDRGDRCPCRCAGCLGAERRGCQNEAGPMPRLSLPLTRAVLPSGLCPTCRAEYAALAPRTRDHVAHLGRVDPIPGRCPCGQRAGECGVCGRVARGVAA